MDLNFEGIVLIVGSYGSGKTEVAVNLAIHQKKAGKSVRVADLDLVNPYFRTREAKQRLAELEIDLVLPPAAYLNADLPILSPAVSGMIKKPGQLTILDVGGDDAGATVLAALSDAFDKKPVQMLQVINPNRPFTESIEGCIKIKNEIENASRLKITGLAGNANLIEETRSEDIYSGYAFLMKLSDQLDLPLEFITAAEHLLDEIDRTRFQCPVLPVYRQMVPPWLKPVKD